MAVNLVIEHLNKRYNVKVGPLKTLSAVLEEVCGKVKPALNPGCCKLMHKGAVQDLSTPLRFLNIPSGTKLELISDRQLGIEGSHRTNDAPGVQVEVAHRSSKDVGKVGAGAAKAEKIKEDIAHDIRTSVECGKESIEAREAIESEAASDAWTSLSGVGRNFSVYDRDSLVGDPLEESIADVPDEFYNFTAEDYHRVMLEHKARVEKEEAGLRTQALRDKEEQRRAEALGAVNMRLIFPSGIICQAQFKATETVAALYDFASSIATCRRPGLVLYTAPPRVDLTDFEATLYKAQLVPAANVYVGQPCPKKGKNGNVSKEPIELKDEVLKLKTNAPPRLEPYVLQGEDPPTSKAVQNVDHAEPRKTSKTGNVPKWMKIGK